MQEALTDELSGPLKKVHAAYLLDVSKNCYQDKWMREDGPNEPQVQLCRQETYNKYFSKWQNELVATRDSAKFRFADCVRGAKGNLFTVVGCGETYVETMANDNKDLSAFFRKEYSKYM